MDEKSILVKLVVNGVKDYFDAVIASVGIDEKEGKRIYDSYFEHVVKVGDPGTTMIRTMEYIRDLSPEEVFVIGHIVTLSLIVGVLE